jgi:hypothetical protein
VTPESKPSPPDNGTCAIVVDPSGRKPDERLAALLDERQWEAVAIDDPHLALAELCVRERLEVSRSAWGLARAGELALVISPSKADDEATQTRQLFNAVRTYVPRASVWLFASGELLPLTEASRRPEPNEPSITKHDAASAHRTVAPRSVRQSLHLSEQMLPDEPGRIADRATEAPEKTPDLDELDRVTADELHMLFERGEGGSNS